MTSWNEVNLVAVTKLVPLIVEVPENEMLPVMGIGVACKLKAKPATVRKRHMVFTDRVFVFISFFLLIVANIF